MLRPHSGMSQTRSIAVGVRLFTKPRVSVRSTAAVVHPTRHQTVSLTFRDSSQGSPVGCPNEWRSSARQGLPSLGDANGNALDIRHQVLLRARFGNALYRILFYVVDHLACPILLGTQFANRHIEAIGYILGELQFTQENLDHHQERLARATVETRWSTPPRESPTFRRLSNVRMIRINSLRFFSPGLSSSDPSHNIHDEGKRDDNG